MNRFSRSWALAKESLAVLRRTPSLIWFPVLSGLMTLGITVSFVIPTYILTGGKDLEKIRPEVGYPLLFAFYFVSYFVVIFFNSGLVACAYDSLTGKETSFGDGLRHAVSRLPAILGWALISATVGMLLKLVSERSGLIGRIVISIIGGVWNLITYFVVPVIVVEKGSPVAAIKKSGGMLKKTWGENLIGNIGLGWAMGILMLVPVLPIILVCLTGIAPLIIAVICLAVLYWLALSVVGASLSGVYQTALYVYAETGSAPQGFSQDSIAGAFRSKPDGVVGKIRNRF